MLSLHYFSLRYNKSLKNHSGIIPIHGHLARPLCLHLFMRIHLLAINFPSHRFFEVILFFPGPLSMAEYSSSTQHPVTIIIMNVSEKGWKWFGTYFYSPLRYWCWDCKKNKIQENLISHPYFMLSCYDFDLHILCTFAMRNNLKNNACSSPQFSWAPIWKFLV